MEMLAMACSVACQAHTRRAKNVSSDHERVLKLSFPKDCARKQGALTSALASESMSANFCGRIGSSGMNVMAVLKQPRDAMQRMMKYFMRAPLPANMRTRNAC